MWRCEMKARIASSAARHCRASPPTSPGGSLTETRSGPWWSSSRARRRVIPGPARARCCERCRVGQRRAGWRRFRTKPVRNAPTVFAAHARTVAVATSAARGPSKATEVPSRHERGLLAEAIEEDLARVVRGTRVVIRRMPRSRILSWNRRGIMSPVISAILSRPGQQNGVVVVDGVTGRRMNGATSCVERKNRYSRSAARLAATIADRNR